MNRHDRIMGLWRRFNRDPDSLNEEEFQELFEAKMRAKYALEAWNDLRQAGILMVVIALVMFALGVYVA